MKNHMKKIMALVLCVVCVILATPTFASTNSRKITVYAPDGRTATIWSYDLTAWKGVGWYEYPVDTVYAPDGRTTVIALADVPAWKGVGWYTVPVTTVYAPDGRTAVIAISDVPAWVAVGWTCPTYTPAAQLTVQTVPSTSYQKEATIEDLTTFVKYINLSLKAQSTATQSLTNYFKYDFDARFKSLFFDGIRTSHNSIKEAYNMSLNYSNLGIFSTPIKNIMDVQNDILNGKYSTYEMTTALTKIINYHKEIAGKLQSFQ